VDLTHIYCELCGIQEARFDEMGGTDVSKKFKDPTDIVCSKCHLVIATMYNPIEEKTK